MRWFTATNHLLVVFPYKVITTEGMGMRCWVGLGCNCNCVIVSGRIKGAARVTNVMYPCGFICIPVVSTLCRMNLIKN